MITILFTHVCMMSMKNKKMINDLCILHKHALTQPPKCKLQNMELTISDAQWLLWSQNLYDLKPIPIWYLRLHMKNGLRHCSQHDFKKCNKKKCPLIHKCGMCGSKKHGLSTLNPKFSSSAAKNESKRLHYICKHSDLFHAQMKRLSTDYNTTWTKFVEIANDKDDGWRK